MVLERDEETLEVTPTWSNILLVLLAKALEEEGKLSIFDPSGNPEPQREPYIGRVFSGEVFIDTGSRSARSTSGIVEGFVLKTSILLRYWDGTDLDERILYPFSPGSPSFLTVKGDDRKRQASLYMAELAMIASLLQDDPPLKEKVEGPLLLVRHGSLLQSLGMYFNPVFDLERQTAEAILLYTGLDKLLVKDLVDRATVVRNATEKVNPGLIAAQLLAYIKKKVKKGHSVVGLAEDVSTGRHLTTLIFVKAAKEVAKETPRGYRPASQELLDLGIMALPDKTCLEEFVETPITSLVHQGAQYLESVLSAMMGVEDRYKLAEILGATDLRTLTDKTYERQALRFFNVASDSHLLLMYNYLYKRPENRYSITSPIDKSWLYEGRIRDSFIKRIGDSSGLDLSDIIEATGGVQLRYMFPEPAPGCVEIAREADRLGVNRVVLSDLIRVIPPLKLEYFSDDTKISYVISHLLAQALVTTYGVPPQLLVVDARSRIHEWEYGALASLLESISRRVAPYSTFIRDFSTRRLHLF